MIPTHPDFGFTMSAIVARSLNGVIGRDGDLPWRLASDLKHFKWITMGKPCVMGRKTWESLPFPLPKRPNLILTRDESYTAKGAEIFTDLSDMVGRAAELAGASGETEVMVIGGAELYRLLMPWTGRVYETIVETEIEGDAHFAPLDEKEWVECDWLSHPAGPKDDHPFVTRIMERR